MRESAAICAATLIIVIVLLIYLAVKHPARGPKGQPRVDSQPATGARRRQRRPQLINWLEAVRWPPVRATQPRRRTALGGRCCQCSPQNPYWFTGGLWGPPDHRGATFALIFEGGADLVAGLARNADIAAALGLQTNPAILTGLMEPAARPNSVTLADRRRSAREAAQDQGGALGVALDTYTALASQEIDDPQNVHDPGVLVCLGATIARLRTDQGDDLDSLPSVSAVVADLEANGPQYSDGRPELVEDAIATAKRAALGEEVIAIGATDRECLCRVWARADDPRNAGARAQMRQALFDALVDCWEVEGEEEEGEGEERGVGGRDIVCVNGRVSRILSSLVLLDWDQRNWVVKKLEQFKNDVFQLAHQVITAEALRATESDKEHTRNAGRMYLATTAAEAREIGEVPESAAEELAETMRNAISEAVDKYIASLEGEVGLKGAISPQLAASIKEEAQAAVV